MVGAARRVLGLAAVAAVAGAGPSAAQGAAPAQPLTVATFNIAHARFTGGNLDRLAAVLRSTRAEVIGLQEVDRSWSRSGGVDQAAELARRLGMRHVFDPNLDCAPRDATGDGFCQYGTATLSRHPLVVGSVHGYALPATVGEEPRGLSLVRVRVGGRTVDVFNTHLSFVESTRVRQVAALRARVTRLRRPFVVMGDLNALPFHLEMVSLREVTRDVAIAAGRPDLRTTTLANPVRLDYIMVPRPGVNGPAGRVEVRFAGVVGGPAASDHRPLFARLTFPGVTPSPRGLQPPRLAPSGRLAPAGRRR